MHIHILGICGTFMGSLAILAEELGYKVTGMDKASYPPMSQQLDAHGIDIIQSYDPKCIPGRPDLFIVGNAISRGNPCLEFILNHGLPFTSGPGWLAQRVLKNRWVLAVAGTHGKSTTSSILAFILENAGLEPGFLIGAVPNNFGVSARVGREPFFVVEADEYDTAFFDKRPKHLHYHPRTLVMTNIEYDHADIYPNIEAIIQQFHYLVRTVPSNGLIVAADDDLNITQVLEKGSWTSVTTFGLEEGEWSAKCLNPQASEFLLMYQEKEIAEVTWPLIGLHNVKNALAAVAAACHVGVSPEYAAEALSQFTGVKRRLEKRAEINAIRVYEDFAHHPTAIKTTLAGLRGESRGGKIIAVVDLASNSMKAGIHNHELIHAFEEADRIYFHIPAGKRDLFAPLLDEMGQRAFGAEEVDELSLAICRASMPQDQIVLMSNKDITPLLQQIMVNLDEAKTQ